MKPSSPSFRQPSQFALGALSFCLGACIFGGEGDGKPQAIDYFSGGWEQVFPQGRVTHTWLTGNRFETVLTKTAPAGDTVMSDAIYHYSVSPDSSLIHYSLDSVVQSRFPIGEVGSTYHLYYRGRRDSLLLGFTGPYLAVLAGVPGKHVAGSLFGEWGDNPQAIGPFAIRADSTGNLFGMPARFIIDADRITYLPTEEDEFGGAFYYRVTGDSLRLWKAKYDCGDSGCRVDGEYNLRKLAAK